MNNHHEKEHQVISDKLPILILIFAGIILIGFFFLKEPKMKYAITETQMLEELVARKAVLRPQQLATILYSHDSLYRFIDLRSPAEFIKGHLPNAINIPVHRIFEDAYKEILNQDEKINILYHSDHCGACGPWMLLEQVGYKNNRILLGGYDFVKPHILDTYSPETGDYLNEKPKYDFAKVVSQTSSGSSSSTGSTTSKKAPVKKKKTKRAEEEGGC